MDNVFFFFLLIPGKNDRLYKFDVMIKLIYTYVIVNKPVISSY